jgi:hypothetical protein
VALIHVALTVLRSWGSGGEANHVHDLRTDRESEREAPLEEKKYDVEVDCLVDWLID